jgi:hypothetical protein
MTPYWQLAPPYWELASRRTERRPLIKPTTPIYRTVLPSPELIERATVEGGAILNMRFALFGVWQEINNPAEGHFLERIQRGAFAKSARESLRNIRAVLSHGKDPSLGQTVLGRIQSIEETADAAVARVDLFPSVPALLVDGLKAEQYGASFRGSPIKSHIERRPPRSAHNPLGIPEVTRQEIRLRDIGPTPFGQYEGTSAQIQGITDALVAARSRPAGRDEIERPYWSLADLKDQEPTWKLNRREDRGRVYAK